MLAVIFMAGFWHWNALANVFEYNELCCMAKVRESNADWQLG